MVQKIKKEVPIKKCTDPNDMLDFLKKNNKADKQNVKNVKIDRNQPSKISSLVHWKNKDISKWDGTCFLGYYLHIYNETFGEEDIEFKGLAIDNKLGKERGEIKRCLDNIFDGDKQEFKNYIDFIFGWWNSSDSFTNGLPSIKSIFGRPNFIKIYRSRKITKKKIIKTRKEADNQFAEKDAWDNYFDK